MTNPADVSVLVCTNMAGIARTLRMALRGMGMRNAHLVADWSQALAVFAAVDPQAAVVYVDGPDPADDGLSFLRLFRRSEKSPNSRIPIVAVSPRRDLATISAVINAGGHEYVLFPAAGDALLKKIVAARQSNRPFIEMPGYVGPCRRRREDKAYAGPERRAAPVPAVAAAG